MAVAVTPAVAVAVTRVTVAMTMEVVGGVGKVGGVSGGSGSGDVEGR